jgi:hypothetical protein
MMCSVVWLINENSILFGRVQRCNDVNAQANQHTKIGQKHYLYIVG